MQTQTISTSAATSALILEGNDPLRSLNRASNTSKQASVAEIFENSVKARDSRLSCAKIMRTVCVLAGVAIPLALFIINPTLPSLQVVIQAAVASLTCFVAALLINTKPKTSPLTFSILSAPNFQIHHKIIPTGNNPKKDPAKKQPILRASFAQKMSPLSYANFKDSNLAKFTGFLTDDQRGALQTISEALDTQEQERRFSVFKAGFTV